MTEAVLAVLDCHLRQSKSYLASFRSPGNRPPRRPLFSRLPSAQLHAHYSEAARKPPEVHTLDKKRVFVARPFSRAFPPHL